MHGTNRRLMRVEAIRFKMAYLNETVEDYPPEQDREGQASLPLLTTEDFLTIREEVKV
jgi:hypothetical protein